MSRRAEIIFLLVILLLLGLVYAKTLNYELVFDSRLLFAQGPFFTADRPLSDAFTSGFGADTSRDEVRVYYYRPLTSLSFFLEKRIWGLGARGMRALNLILFWLALLVLFYFLKGQGGPVIFPHLFVALFALFPLQLDNIVWVVSRADLLVLLFAALCLYFLDLYIKKNMSRFLAVSILFYVLGQFSKESMVFFLPVLFGYEAIRRGRITPLYHLGNLGASAGFFLLKSQLVQGAWVSWNFLPGIWNNIKLALAASGYYFHSLLLPFDYELFITPGDTVTASRLWWGAAFLVFLVLLTLWVRSHRALWFPFLFFIVFLGGHLVLVFSELSPYRASTRFLLFPLVGLLWLFARWLSSRAPLIRYVVGGVLLLSFIPALLIQAEAYRDDVHFWRRMTGARPDNAVFLYMSSQAHIQAGDFLEAEVLLDRALAMRMDWHTAFSVTLSRARLCFVRADYRACLSWLERLNFFKSRPMVELEEGKLRAEVLAAQGRVAEAEGLLLHLISRFRNREVYDLLLDLYLGRMLWDRALRQEERIGRDFPDRFRPRAERLRAEFPTLDAAGRADYFIRFRNFHRALDLLREAPADLKRDLRIIKLWYLTGETDTGREEADRIADDHRDDAAVLNILGYFYLKELARPAEALAHFVKSLEIDPDQANIHTLARYLRGFLSRALPQAPADPAQSP